MGVFLLTKSALPLIKNLADSFSRFETISASSEDQIVYEEIFEPAGLSWMSYNAIKSSSAIEWIDVASNEEVMLSEANKKAFLTNDIYWLARGEINIANSEGQMSKQMIMRNENRLILASNAKKHVAGG